MTAVKIHRWTVLERETDAVGRLTRDDRSYHRTKAPQEEREEQVIRFVNRGRVKVSWGGVPIVASADFMLRSGRCIGNPDWVLVASELKELRKLAQAAFPRKKKVRQTKTVPEEPVAPPTPVSDS